MNTIKTDVLIVGGGGAGVMAALEASHNSCRVTLLDKGIPGKECATLMAYQLSVVSPWIYPHDSAEKYADDILISGCFINNKPLVRTFVKEATATIEALEKRGMLFEREVSGKRFLSGGQHPGHSYPRSLTYKETAGKMILDALRREAIRKGIQMLPDTLTTHLVVEDNQTRGAVCWNIVEGEICCVESKAVVLATGGCGQLYPMTSNPEQATGEGYTLGYEAGAELLDMEMVQFNPVCLVHPKFLRGRTTSIRGKLLNARMERFMDRVDRVNLENLTRDRLSQAIYREIKRGLTSPHGGVYLRASDFDPAVYQKRYPTDYRYCLDAGIDPKTDLLEVAPAAHFMMGGIKIDPCCRTNVKGLFAAGEVAGGLHGANRLANNALTEIFVFGRIAGREAGSFALAQKGNPLSTVITESAQREIMAFLRPKKETIRGFELKEAVRDVMWNKVGVIRNVSDLKQGVESLQKIEESVVPRLGADLSHKSYNRDVIEALEARAMVKLALLIARSASMRLESRGAHCLEDFPEQNDQEYLKNVVICKRSDGQTELSLKATGGGVTE